MGMRVRRRTSRIRAGHSSTSDRVEGLWHMVSGTEQRVCQRDVSEAMPPNGAFERPGSRRDSRASSLVVSALHPVLGQWHSKSSPGIASHLVRTLCRSVADALGSECALPLCVRRLPDGKDAPVGVEPSQDFVHRRGRGGASIVRCDRKLGESNEIRRCRQSWRLGIGLGCARAERHPGWLRSGRS